jgi:hypothetical protein
VWEEWGDKETRRREDGGRGEGDKIDYYLEPLCKRA